MPGAAYHPTVIRMALYIAALAVVVGFTHFAAAADGARQTAQAAKQEPPSAMVVMYHRFGEQALPSTNIGLDQFESHLAELTLGKHVVRSLDEIVSALKAGGSLNDRTIGISIDDAFLSVYREAWPRLREAGLPFTLFVATDAVDRGGKGYMNWDQIRELARAGVTIGNQTASHPHLPMLTPKQVKQELDKSQRRFERELGMRPSLFAYPFGEASSAVMAAIRAAGFTAAFGQHSGVLHGKSDFAYLPRFAMNEHYGSLSRFRQAADALPLHATEITPLDPTLGPNPPAFGFTVGESVSGLGRLACYSSVHGKLAHERLGQRRFEVRTPAAFGPGRARINCTLPAGAGRWRWFGMQFFIPKK
ncbi:MAG: polysaccharide deacetylase family protein [Alphaproteobacteria bacterium]|nr:polysaccharide deacetylase family protein [Alphaproteobacteria bacterium]